MPPRGAEPGSGSIEDHEPDRLMILSGSQAHYLYIGSEPVSLTTEGTPMGKETIPRRVFSTPLEASRSMEWYDGAGFSHHRRSGVRLSLGSNGGS